MFNRNYIFRRWIFQVFSPLWGVMNTSLSAIIEPLRCTVGFFKNAGTGATFHYEHPGSVCFRFVPTCSKILKGVSLVVDVQNSIRKAFCLIILAFNLAKSSCIEFVIHLLDWWKNKVLGEIMSILAQE